MKNTRFSLKSIIIPSIPLAVLAVIACFLLWILPIVYLQLTLPEPSFFSIFKTSVFDNPLLISLFNFLISLFNAFLLVQLNTRFTLIKTRTFLPVLIFLILLGSWSQVHTQTSVHITLSLFIFSLFFLFDMYRNSKAVEQSFLVGICIGCCSLISNPFLFLIPLTWMAYIMFQCLSLRTFLASLFGVICCWILYIAGRYLFNPDMTTDSVFSFDRGPVLNIANLSRPLLIYFSSLCLLLLVNIIGMFSNFHTDAIHTRSKLNFLVLELMAVVLLSLFFLSHFISFLPLIACIYALLVSHTYTLKLTKFHTILFILFCMANLAYAITSLIYK